MTPAARPSAPLRDPAWVPRVFWTSAALVLLWPLMVATEFKPWILFERDNLKVTGQFLATFLPPASCACAQSRTPWATSTCWRVASIRACSAVSACV